VKIKIDQNMKIRNFLKCGMIASVMLLAHASWAAEETDKQSGLREIAPVFDISFPGGNLTDFVTYLDKTVEAQVAKKPNLVFPDEARKVPVPKIELRSVDLRTLMIAMNMLLQRDYTWQQIGPSPTWVLMSRPDARKTQAYYIGHLLKKSGPKPAGDRTSTGFKVADITTALETVWQMDSAVKPELKYHEDTQMLVIRADHRQIQMAENVLNQLRGAVAEDALREDLERAKTAAPAPVTDQPKAPRAR
jgi:hypothetical protein